MNTRLAEYLEEVIEAIEEVGRYSHEEAMHLAGEKMADIEYGCKYHLSSSIVAGAILGINGCCLANMPDNR